ncbi:hypothetical protein B0H13DRAFT_1875601 [Mycena leptocephala]|nr:hypothetical protein B0H13DRAFT_1875601 [Mycena leptocephala]
MKFNSFSGRLALGCCIGIEKTGSKECEPYSSKSYYHFELVLLAPLPILEHPFRPRFAYGGVPVLGILPRRGREVGGRSGIVMGGGDLLWPCVQTNRWVTDEGREVPLHFYVLRVLLQAKLLVIPRRVDGILRVASICEKMSTISEIENNNVRYTHSVSPTLPLDSVNLRTCHGKWRGDQRLRAHIIEPVPNFNKVPADQDDDWAWILDSVLLDLESIEDVITFMPKVEFSVTYTPGPYTRLSPSTTGYHDPRARAVRRRTCFHQLASTWISEADSGQLPSGGLHGYRAVRPQPTTNMEHWYYWTGVVCVRVHYIGHSLPMDSHCKQHRTATQNNPGRPGYCCVDCTLFPRFGFWFNLHGFSADGHSLFNAVTYPSSTPALGLWPCWATSQSVSAQGLAAGELRRRQLGDTRNRQNAVN